MKLTDYCPCCWSNNLYSNQAVFMPFITKRIFGWEPTEITEDWKMITLKQGTSYLPCHTLTCGNCGFIFSDIRFDDDEMARLYDDYRGKNYTELREVYEPGYAERNELLHSENHVDLVERFIRKIPGTVLDYGGDAGEKTPFGSVASVDILDISDKQLPNKVHNVEKTYDLVVCAHLLEHVSYPARILKDIKKAMTSDSALYIELPLEKNVIDYTQKRHWHEHINFFTKDSLYILLNNMGFSITQYKETNINGLSIYMILCKLM